jgi:hypothetical protein
MVIVMISFESLTSAGVKTTVEPDGSPVTVNVTLSVNKAEGAYSNWKVASSTFAHSVLRILAPPKEGWSCYLLNYYSCIIYV